MNVRVEIAAVVIGALVVGAFFYAPIVHYSQAISIPGNYKFVRSSCLPGTVGSSSVGSTSVTTTAFSCMAPNGTLPATFVVGYGSLAYALLGYGTSPYPSEATVKQGNMTALVNFEGGKAVTAENLGKFATLINPKGIVTVALSSLTPAQFSELNFTATLTNIGNTVILEPGVWLDAPGADSTYTSDGVTWLTPYFVGGCETPLKVGLLPGGSCSVKGLVNALGGGVVDYHVVVQGMINGTQFVYRQGFQQEVPSAGIGSVWVTQFIQQVNEARVGTPLVENASLDAFAAQRFKTASFHPDISDYNFTQDAAAWFSSDAGQASETLLFPGGYTPDSFALYLQSYASGHWSALTSQAFTQRGYYGGEAPFLTVSANCPVQEVLNQGVNITQYFQAHGCTVTPVPGAIWLVIVLGQ